MESIVAVAQEKQKEVVELVRGTAFDFGDLLNKAFSLAKNYSDTVVKGSELNITRDMYVKDGRYTYSMSEHAFSQLCAKIGVPVSYMKKCLSNEAVGNLAQINLNTWLGNYDRNLLLRLNDNKIRGVLSTKYSICDSEKVLEAVSNVLDTRDYKLNGYVLNDERLHVRLIGDRMNVPGEDLFAGLQIDSSDVGRNNLKVQFFIYKQVCTNGLVVPKLGGTIFQQKHIGITSSQFEKSLVSSLDVLPELVARATSVITNTKDTKVTGKDFEHMLELVKRDIALSDDSLNKVVDLYSKYQANRWGVVNALTEVAQDFTLERRLEIEEYASKLLIA